MQHVCVCVCWGYNERKLMLDVFCFERAHHQAFDFRFLADMANRARARGERTKDMRSLSAARRDNG